MSVRPRGRDTESRGPSITKGMDAVDRYLVALDEGAVDATTLAMLEVGFVAHAKPFAARRGISFGAWRDVGVPVSVLARAGIRDDWER